MEIKIKETGKIEHLSIIDPASGCDWIGDLLGNHDAYTWDDDEEIAVMDQEDYEWWSNLVAEKERADDRAYELKQELSGHRHEDFVSRLGDVNCDLEDEPKYINSICDEFEGN